MSAKLSESQRLADAVSRLLYGVAGWLLIGLGLLDITVTVFRLVGNSAAVLPSDLVLSGALRLISVLFVLFGVFVNPWFRERLDRRHALTRFGHVQSVDQRVLHAEEGRTERCVNCGTRLTEGLRRRYREDLCVAGIPILTSAEGYNHYCVDCAASELDVATQAADVQAGTETESKTSPELAAGRR